ncbi:YerC/YecD family TrpR-related protein [Sphingomonas sp.]|uniref:YerC/YecD family TrpR-related protein n=1 Tax=Sphingomonas sp. TaxID=28214 RepID=UPI0025CEBF2C|nr:YerC/YecD family TrpR-related protein [Sphingomonas sp.]
MNPHSAPQSPAPEAPIDALATLLSAIWSEAEARAVLRDLCTPAEVRTLAERWQVAKLLDKGGMTYRDIHDATGVSTTTIVRVARFLKEEQNGGYRLLLDRMKDAK